MATATVKYKVTVVPTILTGTQSREDIAAVLEHTHSTNARHSGKRSTACSRHPPRSSSSRPLQLPESKPR